MLFRWMLCLLCSLFWSNYSLASDEPERPAFPLSSPNWQTLMEQLESLDQQISHTSSMSSQAIDLWIERGIILFIAGKHDAAINDFTYAIDSVDEIPEQNRSRIIGEALWGRLWAYAFLGKKNEFLDDLHSVSELFADCYNFSEEIDLAFFQLNQRPIILCKSKKKHKEDDQGNGAQNNNGEGVQFCIDTVRNTVAFMKGMCNVIPDQGIRTTLHLFIDGLGQQSIRCCTAKGFWRTCVEPMVEKINKWKIYGVPADPYWD